MEYVTFFLHVDNALSLVFVFCLPGRCQFFSTWERNVYIYIHISLVKIKIRPHVIILLALNDTKKRWVMCTQTFLSLSPSLPLSDELNISGIAVPQGKRTKIRSNVVWCLHTCSHYIKALYHYPRSVRSNVRGERSSWPKRIFHNGFSSFNTRETWYISRLIYIR